MERFFLVLIQHFCSVYELLDYGRGELLASRLFIVAHQADNDGVFLIYISGKFQELPSLIQLTILKMEVGQTGKECDVLFISVDGGIEVVLGQIFLICLQGTDGKLILDVTAAFPVGNAGEECFFSICKPSQAS